MSQIDIQEMFDVEKAARREQERLWQVVQPVVTVAFNYQNCKQRAVDTLVIPHIFLNLCNAARVDGIDGLKVTLEPLRPQEQKKALHNLSKLEPEIYFDTITEDDITAVAHRNNWTFRRAKKWLQRYRTRGLWGLTSRFNPLGCANETRECWDADVAGLPEEARKKADKKFSYIEPLLENSTDETVRKRAEDLQGQGEEIDERTLWDYLRRYRAHGLIGLHRKTRSDKNRPRRNSEEMEDIIRALRLCGKYPSTDDVWKAACKIARHRGEPEPSLEAVDAICSKISAAIKFIADGNEDGYKKERPTGPILIPEDKIIIQIDSTKVDLLSLDQRPPDQDDKSDKNRKVRTVRCNLIIAYDKNSGKVVARRYLLDDPDRFDAGAIVYYVLRTVGEVDEIWVDHGKIYNSEHLKSALAEIGVKLVILPPRSPQLKGGVERFFRTLNLGFWRYLPGYVGSNTKERPSFIKVELTPAETQTRLDAFIDKYNNKRKRRTKLTPNEYWKKYYGEAFFFDPEDLDVLLKARKYNTVQRNGVPYYDNMYWHEELVVNHKGDQVEIRADPYEKHPDEVQIYYNNKRICTARKDPPSRRELKAAQRRFREQGEEAVAWAQKKIAELEPSIEATLPATASKNQTPSKQRTQTQGEKAKKVGKAAKGPSQDEDAFDILPDV